MAWNAPITFSPVMEGFVLPKLGCVMEEIVGYLAENREEYDRIIKENLFAEAEGTEKVGVSPQGFFAS